MEAQGCGPRPPERGAALGTLSRPPWRPCGPAARIGWPPGPGRKPATSPPELQVTFATSCPTGTSRARRANSPRVPVTVSPTVCPPGLLALQTDRQTDHSFSTGHQAPRSSSHGNPASLDTCSPGPSPPTPCPHGPTQLSSLRAVGPSPRGLGGPGLCHTHPAPPPTRRSCSAGCGLGSQVPGHGRQLLVLMGS